VFHSALSWFGESQVNKEPKGRITRKEDELKVGLARYQRPQSKWPWWAVEYGGWIVVVLVLLFVIVPFGFLGWRLTSDKPAPREGSAKLVVVAGPTRIWAEGSASRLKSVSVRVANQGAGPAMGVKVTVAIDNHAFPLQGATNIESGRADTFTGEVNRSFVDGQSMQVSLTCDTCPQ
jgi:hypothetical protein